jgi:hypothetical protein
MVGTEYIDVRLMGLLAFAFEQVPLVHTKNHKLFNRIYMAGPAFEHRHGEARRERFKKLNVDKAWIAPSTDDWPFLYLKSRGVSTFYLQVMFSILVCAILGVYAASRAGGSNMFTKKGFDAELFLFGMAFLLIETRSVTSMNLIWGATWLTSAVVFASILLMVLMATIITQTMQPSYRKAMIGLVLVTLAAFLTPTELLVGRGVVVKFILSAILTGGPIYFASICFAVRFKSRESADKAFGWNILGAVVGGLTEFFSMATGLKSLLLVALVAYLLAYSFALKDERAQIDT